MKRLMYVLFFVLLTSGMAYAQQAKYVFYFIGDGMGVNQVNGTEMYLAEQEGRIGVKPLLFTSFPVASMATTFSATNSVTDSSAAGTALATGAKTYNGAIGMDDNKSVLQSVAERAKKSGKKVGVTTSVSVDHATPAAFYAHQPDRGMYYEIALDLPKAGFDFYAVGFKKLVMEPVFPDGLDEVSASYGSVYGEIKSAWTKKGGDFSWDITLPGNTSAIVRIPKKYNVTVGNLPGVRRVSATEGYMEVEIGSGSYHFGK